MIIISLELFCSIEKSLNFFDRWNNRRSIKRKVKVYMRKILLKEYLVLEDIKIVGGIIS